MPMDYDTWLQSGPGGPYDEPNPCGDIDFTTKLRGGTVKVYATTTTEDDCDEDGHRTYLSTTVTDCHWTFDTEATVDLTEDEVKELEEEAHEIATDI